MAVVMQGCARVVWTLRGCGKDNRGLLGGGRNRSRRREREPWGKTGRELEALRRKGGF